MKLDHRTHAAHAASAERAPHHGRRRPRLIVGATAVALGAAVASTAVAPPAQARDAGAAVAAPAVAAAQDSITPAMLALGDSIFRGRVAGALCMACHGLNGRGAPGLGPDLTDDRWLHGDGGMDFLVRIIRTGVPQPKEAGAPMPPFGGAPLDDRQLRAVAAYVYRLSRPSR